MMSCKERGTRLGRDQSQEPVEEMKQRIGRIRQLHDELAAKNLDAAFRDERTAGNSPGEPANNERPASSPLNDGETSVPEQDRKAECASSQGEESNEEIANDNMGDPFADEPRRPSVTARITNLKIEAARLRRVIAERPEQSHAEKVRLPQVEQEIAELSKQKQISVHSGVEVPRGSEHIGELPSGLTETVKNPSYIAADAFEIRAKLAEEANVLEMALDVADTIGASNSVDRMLAEEFALGHRLAMHLGKRALEERPHMHAVRLAKASTNAMASCRATAETMVRIRRDRQPLTTVRQNMSVHEGADADVHGSPGRRKGSRERRQCSKAHGTASKQGERQ